MRGRKPTAVGEDVVMKEVAAPPTTRSPRHSSRRSVFVRFALALVWLGALGAAAVAAAGAAVHAGRTVFPVDLPIVEWLAGHRSAVMTLSARVVTTAASPVGLVITLLLVIGVNRWRRGNWQPAVAAAVTWGGIVLVESSVKAWVARPRPPLRLAVDHVPAHGFSFPSGHTAQSTAVYGFLAVLLWRHFAQKVRRITIVVVAVLAISAVGFSRLYLGVHWFSDVLAGWLIGLSWLAVVLAGLAVLAVLEVHRNGVATAD